jgi:curli biogenesis system outer membrane secretion channel CsgG
LTVEGISKKIITHGNAVQNIQCMPGDPPLPASQNNTIQVRQQVMKRRSILCLVTLLIVSVGCSQVNMGSSSAKSTATGSAGGANVTNANADLERCTSPIGTLAVNEDHTANWYTYLSRHGIQSTVPVLRLLAQQSNCFVVVERGAGMGSVMRERELEQMGELRKNSDFGKGKMVSADYTVTPTLIFQADDTGGIGGAVGGLFGSVGAMVGSKIQTKSAQSMLALVDNRSGVQVAVAEGSGSSMDVGGIMGLLGGSAGGGLGAYKKTPQGKVVVAAMTDAFNNLVVAVKNYRAQEATGPKGMGTGGKLQVN